MKFKSSLIFLLFFCFITKAQVTNFKEKFELPEKTKETSGLLFFNSKIITHNDSGDDANLYEIDSLSGNLLRTISISNATNVDWEDITEDESYIYIGDIGNNNGNRTDLKIYKILKSDYINNESITAEIIEYSYEDQVDFSSKPNNNNFDAEAIIVFENSLLVFTKNWVDFKTNVYKIPLNSGTHTAVKISSADIEGLITGASNLNGNLYLCGDDSSFIPFLVYISFNRPPGDDIFASGFEKESLQNKLEVGSQVEAITSFDTGRYYISRESVNNQFANLPQKLFEFSDDRDFLLSVQENNSEHLTISPNPFKNSLHFKSEKKIKSLFFFNTLGSKLLKKFDTEKVENLDLAKGIYFVKIIFEDKKSVTKKIIKL